MKFKLLIASILLSCSFISAQASGESDSEDKGGSHSNVTLLNIPSMNFEKEEITKETLANQSETLLESRNQVREVNSEPMSVEEEFIQKIEKARKNIHIYTPKDGLMSLKEVFDKWDYPEEKWEELCSGQNIKKWPSQNWKKAYGGYIFYPHKDMTIIESHPSNGYLVTRPDILFSLVISAAYRNPQAQLEASQALEFSGLDMRRVPELFHEDAITELQTVINNQQTYPDLLPLAYYLLGKNYKKFLKTKESVDCYIKSGTPLSTLKLLRTYKGSKRYKSQRPTLETYQQLAEEWKLPYPLESGMAYYEAASLDEVNEDDTIKFLELASSRGYQPALFELGKYYRTLKNVPLSTKTFLEYGALGYSHGYLEASFNLIGRFGGTKENPSLKSKDPKVIDQVIDNLTQAKKLQNPEAAYCLGIVYQERREMAKDLEEEKRYDNLSQEAFIEATRLGHGLSYQRVHPINRLRAHTYPRLVYEFDYLYTKQKALEKN